MQSAARGEATDSQHSIETRVTLTSISSLCLSLYLLVNTGSLYFLAETMAEPFG